MLTLILIIMFSPLLLALGELIFGLIALIFVGFLILISKGDT